MAASALCGLALAAPVVASLPEFDRDIPVFDPAAKREGKTVALVFDSSEARVERGRSMLLNGDIDQMVLLSFYPGTRATEQFYSGDARLKDIPVFNAPMNTREEALAAMDWFKTQDFQNIVIVGGGQHIRRCHELLSPLAGKCAIFQLPVEWDTNTYYRMTERLKLGMTRLRLITRIPGYQIPYF